MQFYTKNIFFGKYLNYHIDFSHKKCTFLSKFTINIYKLHKFTFIYKLYYYFIFYIFIYVFSSLYINKIPYTSPAIKNQKTHPEC